MPRLPKSTLPGCATGRGKSNSTPAPHPPTKQDDNSSQSLSGEKILSGGDRQRQHSRTSLWTRGQNGSISISQLQLLTGRGAERSARVLNSASHAVEAFLAGLKEGLNQHFRYSLLSLTGHSQGPGQAYPWFPREKRADGLEEAGPFRYPSGNTGVAPGGGEDATPTRARRATSGDIFGCRTREATTRG